MVIPSYIPIIIASTILLVSLSTLITYTNFDDQTQNLLSQFNIWKSKYHRKYIQSVQMFRFEIWKHNFNQIHVHNTRAQQGLESYHMGLNQFSDLTDKQWTYLYLQAPATAQSNNNAGFECTGSQPSDKDLPDAVDWAAKSATSAVRDQGTCAGAGYAFAAAQSIQSCRFVGSGKMIQLSVQQLIDCTDAYGNHGCMSGNVTAVFEYIRKQGIASQKKYPYNGFHYTCSYSASQKEAELMNCVKVTPLKQVSIKAAVRRQPVAVSLNAAKIKQYQKGVFDTSHTFVNNCKTEHNHWMLLVGYGRDQSEKKNYWKLKNSWGSSWGLQGYFYIVRKGDGQGECGVQTQLYFPNAG